MSQIEMKELKDWLNDPTALKFKKILLNSRKDILERIARDYMSRDYEFQKDLILTKIGHCEQLHVISSWFGNSKEEDLENLIKLFLGGENA
jgi:hypothetical protein